MQYQNIPGQRSIKDYLRGAVMDGALPHALLFLGDSGRGPLPMALATAQYLMCKNRSTEESCGKCSDCHKAAKAIHPDIHFSYPTVGSKVTSLDMISEWRSFLLDNPFGSVQDWLAIIGGENKQGNINKDECHRVLKALSLKTYEGEYKVHLLWMAEYLGKEGNRLLKIIEEPPPQTIFILMASDQDAILSTILSRCQLVTFSAIADDDLLGFVAAKAPNLTEDQVRQIVYVADGNIGKASGYLDESSKMTMGLWLEWMRTSFQGNPVEMVKWAEKFAKIDREGQKRLLNYGLHFMRELMISKVDGGQPVRLLAQEKAAMFKLRDLIPIGQLERMMSLITDSIFHLERNGNSRILMLDCSIKMHGFLQAEKELMTT